MVQASAKSKKKRTAKGASIKATKKTSVKTPKKATTNTKSTTKSKPKVPPVEKTSTKSLVQPASEPRKNSAKAPTQPASISKVIPTNNISEKDQFEDSPDSALSEMQNSSNDPAPALSEQENSDSIPNVDVFHTDSSQSEEERIITLRPPKRDPNAIFITFGFSLFLIFSIATFYSIQFIYEIFNSNKGDVMGGQLKNEQQLAPSNSLEENKMTIPDYLVKKGFSKGEINESAIDSFYLSWPVKSGKGIVTQCFSEEHPGVDIADYRSPKILASAEGYVIFAGCFEEECPVDPDIKNSEGLAHAVMIKHPNGMITVYGHLKSISVKEGEPVSRGDVIGIMGNSGNSQAISESGTGIHLHYALITDSSWNYLDPSKFMINKICQGGNPDPEAFWGQEIEGPIVERSDDVEVTTENPSIEGDPIEENLSEEEVIEENENPKESENPSDPVNPDNETSLPK